MSGYEKVRKVAIGGEGGWDFLEVDPGTQRLFVTRGTHVVVLDLESEKVVGEIPDTPGVHGIAFVADLNRGFTSNGGNSSVTAFDTKTLKTLGTVKADGRPDIIYFEPVSRRVFTFNHGSNNTTAIDPDELKVVGTLALGGVPELAVSDEKGHIFVNLENTSEIVEFDARTMKILNRYPLAPGEEPTGLAFDREHRRLFSTLRQSQVGDHGCRQWQGRADPRDWTGARRLRLRRQKEPHLQLQRWRRHGFRDSRRS